MRKTKNHLYFYPSNLQVVYKNYNDQRPDLKWPNAAIHFLISAAISHTHTAKFKELEEEGNKDDGRFCA